MTKKILLFIITLGLSFIGITQFNSNAEPYEPAILFDIPLTLVAPNQEMGGMTIDLYEGTNGQLQALYDSLTNETIPLTPDVYFVNNIATFYGGDVSVSVGFPIPLYSFGVFPSDDVSFLIGDLTPLDMGLGLVLAKFVNVPIPNNNIVIQQGFEFNSESTIIIPDSVTGIGEDAFRDWTLNNQPLVIPNSVTSIGFQAFYGWALNNQPLVIPDSVTSIDELAFWGWTSAKEFIMESETPPTIDSTSFNNTNNAPFYVPYDSVEAYKTAPNWVNLANRIFPMSTKFTYDNGYADGKVDGLLEGYDDGYTDGLLEGYDNGYANGKADGLTEGYDNGYANGKADGLTEGYDNGYADGLLEGYAEGWDEAIEDYINNILPDLLAQAKQEGYDEGYNDGLGVEVPNPTTQLFNDTTLSITLLILLILSLGMYLIFKSNLILLPTIILWLGFIINTNNGLIILFATMLFVITIVITFFKDKKGDNW